MHWGQHGAKREQKNGGTAESEEVSADPNGNNDSSNTISTSITISNESDVTMADTNLAE